MLELPSNTLFININLPPKKGIASAWKITFFSNFSIWDFYFAPQGRPRYEERKDTTLQPINPANSNLGTAFTRKKCCSACSCAILI